MNSELEGLAAENVEKPFTDTLDRNKQHRLPWHDIHMRYPWVLPPARDKHSFLSCSFQPMWSGS